MRLFFVYCSFGNLLLWAGKYSRLVNQASAYYARQRLSYKFVGEVVEKMPDSKGKPNSRSGVKVKRESFSTHSGHALTPLEARFISAYIELGNGLQSVKQAGYKTKCPAQQAQNLLNKVYIIEEINHRLEEITAKKTATAQEIYEYFTRVMRGEEKESDGSAPPIAERTKAAQELAKRIIDIPNKLSEKQGTEYKIILDFKRDREDKSDV